MKQKRLYDIINIVVLLMAVFLFAYTYPDIKFIFKDDSWRIILVFVITAIIVHGIKAFRLYFALFGKNLLPVQHLKQYCKVVPVSVIIPFKLGELFRIYCYGYQIRSYFSGLIVVLLDRFVDTLALITMLFLINVIYGVDLTWFFYILITFLVGVIVIYVIFPDMCSYWKKYFLNVKASKRNNEILNLMNRLSEAYFEVSIIVKGRCTILYILSLIAWCAEIGGLVIASRLLDDPETSVIVSNYLTSAMLGMDSNYLRQFIIISVVLLIGLYLLLHCLEGKGDKKC